MTMAGRHQSRPYDGGLDWTAWQLSWRHLRVTTDATAIDSVLSAASAHEITLSRAGRRVLHRTDAATDREKQADRRIPAAGQQQLGVLVVFEIYYPAVPTARYAALPAFSDRSRRISVNCETSRPAFSPRVALTYY